ncbi:ABC transporter substrate-binding protein [Sinirhodobacter populi]|uniref:ABC transporter substrate-binding protein n=1 Tax=Paenirhodobacter populi TaxID=2306993 RepID=A0A443K6H0_9RHOB|nr:ABC transporter substrate-binding protein [Sinirhodobacter populi]
MRYAINNIRRKPHRIFDCVLDIVGTGCDEGREQAMRTTGIQETHMTDKHDADRIRRLRESVMVPPTARRDFLKLFGGAAALAMAGPMFPHAARAQDIALPEFDTIPDAWKGTGEVVVVTWGGIGTEMQRKAWFEPFEKLCGIKVIEAIGPDPAKLKAMVDTGTVGWDVCQIGRGTMIELLRQGDYLEPIDYSLVEPGVTEDSRASHGLDIVPYSQMIAYRTDVFPEGPKGFKDFWDTEKFRGGRSMPIATKGNVPELVGALIADGVDPASAYPIDIDRAIAKFYEIRPSVVKWWETGAQHMQLLLDNEAPLVTAWNGRIDAAQKEGKPVELVWDGGMLVKNAWLIPKGAPNLSNAQKFAAFSSSAIAQARYSILLPYGFTNADSAKYIPADVLAKLPTAPENLALQVPYQYQWWADNRPEVIEKFNKMMLS